MLQSPETMSPETKRQECLRIAKQMFSQSPDWVTFFREILGIEGVARRLFKTQEDYLAFEQSNEFADIQTMVSKLRTRNAATGDGQEPTRVITVRLPKSLHEALRAEAHDHKTSMNKLCIAKLLQVLAEEGEKQAPQAAAALLSRSVAQPAAAAPMQQVPAQPVPQQPRPAVPQQQPRPVQQARPAQQVPAPSPTFNRSYGTNPYQTQKNPYQQ